MSKVYHLDEVKSSFAHLNLARGYCHQVFLLWHDNISVPVGFWCSCFTILLTLSRVFKTHKVMMMMTAIVEARDAQSLRLFHDTAKLLFRNSSPA